MIGLIKCWIESCIICYFVFHDKLIIVLPEVEWGSLSPHPSMFRFIS